MNKRPGRGDQWADPKQGGPVDPETMELYRGLSRLPSPLWDDLDSLAPDSVCRRAGVIHRPGAGYIVPFLGVDHQIQPNLRSITVPPGARPPGFQTGLVLVNYLIHASEEGLSGRMATARELNGGALFFQGPHTLSKKPVLERYARDAEGLVIRALKWNAGRLPIGDGAFRVLALPKVLVAYTLYEEDDEFKARLTITFDEYTDRHLPLDGIWALINVMTHRLTLED